MGVNGQTGRSVIVGTKPRSSRVRNGAQTPGSWIHVKTVLLTSSNQHSYDLQHLFSWCRRPKDADGGRTFSYFHQCISDLPLATQNIEGEEGVREGVRKTKEPYIHYQRFISRALVSFVFFFFFVFAVGRFVLSGGATALCEGRGLDQVSFFGGPLPLVLTRRSGERPLDCSVGR